MGSIRLLTGGFHVVRYLQGSFGALKNLNVLELYFRVQGLVKVRELPKLALESVEFVNVITR